MATLKTPFLVAKHSKTRGTRWFWQPDARLRAAGWGSQPLGADEFAAHVQARAINDQVALWRAGGIRPDAVADHVAKGTLGALIDRYEKEVLNGTGPDGRAIVAASTGKTYRTALKRIRLWAGQQPLEYVTPARVRALRDAMMQPEQRGGIGHDPAHKTLKMLRTLFAFAISCDLVERNPAANFRLAPPAPRDVIWSSPAREAMVAAAYAGQMPSMALAILLGFAIGQREADLLHLTQARYVEIPAHKMQPEDHATLAALAPDGVVRGIRIRQRKTKAWIEVPVLGEVRTALEASIATARAGQSTAIILDDRRGTQGRVAIYAGEAGQTRFQRDFAEVRSAAIAAAERAAEPELAEELATLQFRDLRRTCVVYLGELGLDAHLIAAITGHDIDETQAILKTYMPRTTGRAARAIALSFARDMKAEQGTHQKEQQR